MALLIDNLPGTLNGSPRQGCLVSAIVSTYNAEAFMQGCMEDLIGQTLFQAGQLEIVVIDSGSTQNEAAIVRAFQTRHPHIQYHRTPRETIYGAWNRGVRAARGRFVTNANTDDRHHPEALARMAAALDADPSVALVYGDQLITDSPHETFARHSARERFGWPRFSLDVLLHRNIIGPQPMWRRSVHDRFGYFVDHYQVAGDWEFWLRLAERERLVLMPDVLGLYYRNRGGLEFSSTSTGAESDEVGRRYRARLVLGAFACANHPSLWGTAMSLPPASPAVVDAAARVEAGDLAAAGLVLRESLGSVPTPELLLALANVLVLQARVGDAAELLRHSLRLYPGRPDLSLRLAQLLLLGPGPWHEAARLAESAHGVAAVAARDVLDEVAARGGQSSATAERLTG